MEQRLSIITLGVENLQEAEKFYLDKFGWTKSPESSENITFLQLNGLKLALYPREKLAEDADLKTAKNNDDFKGFTLAYCTRTEEEVDDLFADFEAKSVRIVKKPHKAFWGGYSGYIADSEGNLWEIAFNPFLKMDEVGNIE
ncbi:MAG: VOC family protein [Chitinophagales bacterium]